MEGEAQDPINMEPLPQVPEQVVEKIVEEVINTNLVVNERYKITGGKYKKLKEGVLIKINKTYSDVRVEKTGPNAPPGIALESSVIKVKNCYLFPVEKPGIDMPDAEDLNVVSNLEQYLKDNPDEEFAGTPEINELGEVVDNITDELPSVEEALKLRQEVVNLKKEINILKEEQLNSLNNQIKTGLTADQICEIVKIILSFSL